jgi:DNA-binding NtrC family response regulator
MGVCVVAELRGKRVLVIEDSPVVAEFAAEALASLGCEVVGPARNMAVARELANSAEVDVALVDVRIRGEKSFAVCPILNRRGVPFVLTSGYADWAVPQEWAGRPQLPKPYKVKDLEVALLRAVE